MLSRLFKVNGEPVFIRGGNWILSDGLLRLSKERYKTDIKFHADMNFNMIRCWGGGIAERPEFYHYCDVYGLLVSIWLLDLASMAIFLFISLVVGGDWLSFQIYFEGIHGDLRDPVLTLCYVFLLLFFSITVKLLNYQFI